MPSNCEYYLYQRYIKYGNSEYVPVYPPEYAISGDTGQDPVIKRCDSPNCGYHEAVYRWHQEDISEAYICSGGNKYYEEIYQVSYDGGFNWENVVPEQTRQGSIYEYDSEDCQHDYSKDYLTFIPISGSSTFELRDFREIVSDSKIYYSLDSGLTWTELAYNTPTPTVNAGEKIMWKGELTPNLPIYYGIGTFTSTNRFDVEGNAMSLLYGDNFIDQYDLTVKSEFSCLFSGCTNVVSAENLSLPATATTLAYYCYDGMFQGCTSLTTAPELPATALSQYCYGSMFKGCTSLTTAPVLSATTLAYACYGGMFQDCTSLTTAPELPATTLTEGCYNHMFAGCTSLTTAPVLSATTLADSCYENMFLFCTSLTTAPELPATTLADSCYEEMFRGCTSLTTAPELPATTLASICYRYMFYGCTSLTSAPVLSATTLADRCYYGMFNGCTSLTTAPELPAATLTSNSYRAMFSGCTSLNYIKCLATDISANNCTTNWVSGVASTGTFTKASSMTNWATGNNGIPNGWTVQNA